MSEQPETKRPEDEAPKPPEGGRAVEDVVNDVEADIRRTIGGWVGASPDDDWDTIGRLMEANFRGRVAALVGVEPGEPQSEVTWDDIGTKIDRSLRQTFGGWAGAKPEDDWETVGEKMEEGIRESVGEAVGEEEPASWETIGQRIETNVRREIGGWVHAGPDADWQTIGDMYGERLRALFGIKAAEESPAPEKKTQVPISGDEEDTPPEA